jgi:sterol desaturase/sphingolipid hydroxylase (fatty acid hydroxylase superfamily)
MAHLPITNDKEPLRLFKSDFLEFFTHIHPAVIVVIWLPLAIFFLVKAVIDHTPGTAIWYLPAGFILGLFLWTLTEYIMHRFVFHYEPRNEMEEKLIFLFHGIHHAQPQCKTRLVMPPAVSIPLALVFYGLFQLVFNLLLGAPQWMYPALSGFVIGYLTYDLMHYATHHFAMRKGFLKFLKRYHMQHHYKTPDKRFGVSSPVWDYVFHTDPE